MADLPEHIRPYFEALQHALNELLPTNRIANRAFLLMIRDVLEAEYRITVKDLRHLKRILILADQVAFPPIQDVKTGSEAEAFLMQACPAVEKLQIHLAMRWLLFLLARHGRIDTELSGIHYWLQIWRRVQTFPILEQSFLADFVHWLENKLFSPRSITDILRECRKFKSWMEMRKLSSISEIDNLKLQRYLLERACGYKNGTKQQILGRLRPLFHYYQEAMDGGYRVPDYTVKAPRLLGVNESANSEEVERLLEALQGKRLPAMAGMMLVLILGYGLMLRSLPSLKTTEEPGKLVYIERLPRKGHRERTLYLDLGHEWIAHYWHEWTEKRTKKACDYLFSSGHGLKHKRPVSVEFCQRTIQVAVESVLGYRIPANHLERGSLKRLASLTSLAEFMFLTFDVPKSRLSRMMYWLQLQQSKA